MPCAWNVARRQTFRLFPEPAEHLIAILKCDGLTQEEALRELPYDAARAGAQTTGSPDPRRLRDLKELYAMVGLLYEDDSQRLRLTELGHTLRRFLPKLTQASAPVLAERVAQSLAAARLRNPIGAGRQYDATVNVNPFQTIWRIMLACERRIDSEELNRAVFAVSKESDIPLMVERIAEYRESRNPAVLGNAVIPPGRAQNDRIIPWMSPASFGWLLFSDKRADPGGYYTVPDVMAPVLEYASRLVFPPMVTDSIEAYVTYLSRCAGVPRDLR